ncbi:LysR substrate-binding domain-containing protein [Pantanalinema rosaneae CENA516]|uniref:LysR family transcriptional regulator n=1 Tax=Pantanalinema rosaneae TaxID=1620701 RepID=UPI003D6F91E1
MMDLLYLSQFELRQICYFILLVQTNNNFSEAAKQIGIKQPPFSQRIQALERSLRTHTTPDVKLFDRSKHPVELTEAGKVFFREAQLAISQLEWAIAQAQRASQGQTGHLTVGIHNSVANTILPQVLRRFQQRFPDVVLELREVTMLQEIQLLKNHQLDIVFHRSEVPCEGDADLDVLPMFQEEFLLVLPADHVLAEQCQVPLQALKNEAIILPPLDILPFYQQIITLCREAGFDPKIVNTISATGIVTLLSLVTAGVGVAILPNHVQVLHREGVVYKPIQGKPLVRHITAVWRQDSGSPTLYNFLDVIQEVISSCPAFS